VQVPFGQSPPPLCFAPIEHFPRLFDLISALRASSHFNPFPILRELSQILLSNPLPDPLPLTAFGLPDLLLALIQDVPFGQLPDRTTNFFAIRLLYAQTVGPLDSGGPLLQDNFLLTVFSFLKPENPLIDAILSQDQSVNSIRSGMYACWLLSNLLLDEALAEFVCDRFLELGLAERIAKRMWLLRSEEEKNALLGLLDVFFRTVSAFRPCQIDLMLNFVPILLEHSFIETLAVFLELSTEICSYALDNNVPEFLDQKLNRRNFNPVMRCVVALCEGQMVERFCSAAFLDKCLAFLYHIEPEDLRLFLDFVLTLLRND
jgi:hypothetical protein